MIHHTVGVYPNDEHGCGRKHNGVTSENLARHIKYNLDFRPGRSLFVDGWCIYTGIGRTRERDEAVEKELQANPRTMERDTAPYQ
jgi:hypothetical protein